MNKNFYKILELDEKASSAEIKKNYRRLAKQYHPDTHPNDKTAESKFKEISEAYDVLSDPEKRKKYDEFRKYGGAWPGGNFNGMNFGDFENMHFKWGGQGKTNSQFGDNMGIGDLFSQFFGGRKPGSRARNQAANGQDVQVDLKIPFEIAALGGKHPFSVNYGGQTKTFSVNIKPGIEDGEKIRLRGQGSPGHGGVAGDLIITVNILPNSHLQREGIHIISKVTINLAQALLGTKIQVTTLEGKKVQLKVNPESQNGQRLRLKGMGIKTKDGRVGDYFVELNVVLPEKLSVTQKKLIEEFARDSNLTY